jgi:isopenicillin N synthase-like dioxygenase
MVAMTATPDTPTRATPRRELPVLDLSTARDAHGEFTPEFLDQLRDAAHNVGFFQLIG